jgi:4'-phosphopantetheinyl transferase
MKVASGIDTRARSSNPAAAIDVWSVSLEQPAGVCRELKQLLSADEIARADRFVFELDRLRYVACRGALRQVLGGYLGVRPEGLTFAYADRGKPSLNGAALGFNVSHAAGLAVFAISEAGGVGIDVECTARTVDFEALGSRFFSAEEASELLMLPETSRREAFFNCWTRKEAYIKAIGDGLACPLDSFAVTLHPDDPPAFKWMAGGAAAGWQLWAFRPAARYIGAVATRSRAAGIRLRRWDAAEGRASSSPAVTALASGGPA